MYGKRSILAGLVTSAILLFAAIPVSAATIQVINLDGANEGFNDPEPRTPVGGNPGTTLGAQRFFAFQFAADLLGGKIASNIVIRVGAEFNPLMCGPTSATLGLAGPNLAVAFDPGDTPPGAQANTFYPVALANAFAGQDLDPGNDIGAEFNSALDEGNDACLGGTAWYYGVDNNRPPGTIDFLSTVTHELIHGLGFLTFANLTTGEWLDGGLLPGDGTPDIYGRMIRDLTQGQDWDQMLEVQRIASAQNDGNVVWSGASATNSGAPTLTAGTSGVPARIRLFAPAPLQPGSSISHWDDVVTPNALMEPFDTGDIAVIDGIGLASCLLQDIGWTLLGGTGCPDGVGSPPSPDIAVSPTSVDFGTVANGATETRVVTVGNTGGSSLNIGTVGSNDSLAPPFMLGSDTCSGATLAANGGTCEIEVDFSPSSQDRFTDSFNIPSDDPNEANVIVDVAGGPPPAGGNSGAGGGGGGGGGGCAMSWDEARASPLLPLLLLMAVLGLAHRRRRLPPA